MVECGDWKIIVNTDYPDKTISRLNLYKLISLSVDSPYTPTVPYLPKNSEDAEKINSMMDSFLAYALDNNEITLIKYKAMNLNRIRKRETKICKFKTTIEAVKESVKKNKYDVGIVPSDEPLEEGMKVCDVE